MGNSIIISIRKGISYILSNELALKDVVLAPVYTPKWFVQEFILAVMIYCTFFAVSAILCSAIALRDTEIFLQLACAFTIVRAVWEALRVIDLTDANKNNESFVLALSVLVSYSLIAWFDFFFPVMGLVLMYFLTKAYFKYLDCFENYFLNVVLF
jgi:predicted outer membrane lipoprotein